MWHDINRLVRRQHHEPEGESAAGTTPTARADGPVLSADQSLRLQATALETVANAVVITDRKGVILWSNPAFTAMTGYSAEETVGQTPRLIKSGRHDLKFYRELWQTILAGRTWRGEFTNRRKDGSHYQGEQTITPLRAEDGTITHFVAVMNDVTAQRQAEAESQVARARLEHLLSGNPGIIYGARLQDGKIIPHYINDGIRPLLGFRPADALSFEWWLEHLHPDDAGRATAAIDETLQRGESRIEYRLRHHDGTYRWVDDHCRLVRDSAGKPVEFIGVMTNITERKRAEEVMQDAARRNGGRQRKRMATELAITAACFLTLFIAGHAFGWFTAFFATASNEALHPYFDEAVAALGLMPIALVAFGYRRWRESKAETTLEQNVTAALQTLHQELESRIQLRTTELARANDAMRREAAECGILQKELIAREQILQSFFAGATAGLAHFDRDLRYVQVNATLAEMNGLTVDGHIGHSVEELLPQLAPTVVPILRQVLATNQPTLNFEITGETPRAPGIKRTWMASYFPIPGQDGNAKGVGTIVVEITDRKRAEIQLEEQREQWQTLVSNSTSAVFVVHDERLVLANPATARLFGASQLELMGRPVLDFILEEDRPLIRARIQHARETEAFLPMVEWRARRADGTVVEAESTSVRFAFAGRPALLIEAREITARKHAEAVARESESRFRQLTENIREVFWLTNPENNEMLYISPAFEKIWGRSCASLLASPESWFEAIHPEDRMNVTTALAGVASGTFDVEYRIVRPDSLVRWIRARAFPVADATGRVYRIAGVAEDITERKLAEDTLRESHRQFRDMLENVDLIAMILDRHGRILFCNQHLLRLTGWRADEVRGKDWFANFVPDTAAGVKKVFADTVAAGTIPTHYENAIKTRTGEIREIAWNNTMLRDAAGNIVGTASIGEDVTDRKQAAARLNLQHAVTEVLAQGLGLAPAQQKILEEMTRGLGWDVGEWWTLDRGAKNLRCVSSWHRGSPGYEEFSAASRQLIIAAGQGPIGEICTSGQPRWAVDAGHDQGFALYAAAARAGLESWIGLPIRAGQATVGVLGFHARHLHEPDPELLSLFATLGSQLGQFLERHELAEQFRQVQKLEAIGTLAGGIAHDFNNIIAAISGYTELAKLELGADSTVQSHHDAVLQASSRATHLVRQILAFSRKHEQERKPVQLRHITAEAVNLLRATVPTMIDFDVRLDSDVPAVLADATQIHQVVMNLGTNAWHAMKDQSGRLGFVLERFTVDADFVDRHPRMKPGAYARLSVSDTGHGMNRETLGRIFEPFFTTKPQGEGTGLGLSVVHGIMESHDGAVTVYSQPGEGTVFRLYFPAQVTAASEPSAATPATPRGHGETILFVDDEAPLAQMGRKILERLGYVVDARTSALEALEAVRSQPQAFDLVVTDLAMPMMSGTELARELLAIRPDLPILLATGYSATLTTTGVQALGLRDLLMKPLSIHSLGTAVNRALTEPIPMR